MPDQFWDGASLIALLTIAGGAIKWAWDQFRKGADSRVADIATREKAFELRRDELIGKLEAEVHALEERMNTQIAELSDRLGRQRRAIDLLVLEVTRLDPGSMVLAYIRALLGEDLPPLPGPLPGELARVVARIDEEKP